MPTQEKSGKETIDRRTFIRNTTAGLGVVGGVSPLLATSPPNDKVVVAVMGVNGRGGVLAESFAKATGSEVGAICDVDERAVSKTVGKVSGHQSRRPEGLGDFRRALENPAIDAIVIAAPDHWHAPAAILALQAGKHVYVEKPSSHNAAEARLLVQAQKKHKRVVQMGNQQRSSPRSQKAIQKIHEGIIGRAYYGKAWYANTRGPIGKGKPAQVPGWLDYELWQGPAPRTPFHDNVVHYNWHWFWRWGTGEICNNGTHELDVCRWALEVDRPLRVNSSGGRYNYDDDWEAYDTQIASFDFSDRKTIVWEGRSCNGFPFDGKSRGASIHGEDGTVFLDRNGYIIWDRDNKEIERDVVGDDSGLDTRSAGSLTDLHIANFLSAIKGDAALTAPIDQGQTSVMLCHLGNIAQRTGRTLEIDPLNGQIRDDSRAMQLWGREYEQGWAPRV